MRLTYVRKGSDFEGDVPSLFATRDNSATIVFSSLATIFDGSISHKNQHLEPAKQVKRFWCVPHYYFHLINDIDVQDLEGIELPDLAAARANAIEQARGMIGEMTKTEARIVLSHHIDIEDEEGRVLDTVMFRDIIKVES